MHIKINKACICGAHWKGTIPKKFAEKVLIPEWNKTHSGEGHKPCDVKTATRKRNHNDNPIFYRYD
ncbi:MAG: hypothetical protein FJ241_08990 [Nitrospira sp.]|nr:hypothetical protein [Nitrospira sp.]